MADKQPMQADGAGSTSRDDELGEVASRRGASAAGGESGGGAYPNPHTGKEGDESGFMGHGGQSKIDYHGPEQLGEQGMEEQPNAGAKND